MVCYIARKEVHNMILVTFEYQNTTYSTVCIGDIDSKFIIDKAESIFGIKVYQAYQYSCIEQSGDIILYTKDSTVLVSFIDIDSLSFPSFSPAETYLDTLQEQFNTDIDGVLEYIMRKLS